MAGRRQAGVTEDEAPEPGVAAVLEALLADLREAAAAMVPRFFATMPEAYFRDTDHATRLSHLKAIIAAEAGGLPQDLILRSADGSRYTYINERSYPGQLGRLVRQLPRDPPLCAAKVYTAGDGRLVLDVFELGRQPPCDPADPAQAAAIGAVLDHARTQAPDLAEGRLERHLSLCTAPCVLTAPPARICAMLRLVERIRGSDDTLVTFEPRPAMALSGVTVASGNADRRALFERLARHFGHCGIDIQRAYLDSFGDPEGDPGGDGVSLLSFLVRGPDGAMLDPAGALWQRVAHDLARLPYLDGSVLALAHGRPGWDLDRAEVLVTLVHLAHQVLVRHNAPAFTRHRLLEAVARHDGHARAIVDLFRARFAPAGADAGDAVSDPEAIAAAVRRGVDNDDDRRILDTLLAAAGATLRTNVYAPGRGALALRLDPALLTAPGREEAPFGVFFVHGRGLDGFHVRFRDIARGGLRIVRPAGVEQYTVESERLYDEAYGLAQAQQLKNKDIPEGGSKGVVLVAPGINAGRGGRIFADALLDLITPDPAVRRHIAGAADEPLYLGPDENVSDALITWIVERARRRGHPTPNAFMSSKPGAGINHKAYGITSEGVTVFLEAALRAVGIDPRRQRFTVKLTGGPDGDVAGNEIRILDRDYGANAVITGIADGSGAAEDPDGLDHGELLRLVGLSRPIAGFDPARLGLRGRVMPAEAPEGLRVRNTLHNRLATDAFIPAGGRPRMINDGNWREFLTPDGRPSSRVIVEGANLFITPEARLHLAACGAVIVKDSSANKCGVICSSFEILASMLLAEDAFLAVKERFVAEVIVRLRALAGLEAELLFREHRHKPAVPLPELSTRVSRAIIAVTDAIAATMLRLDAHDRDLARWLVRQHLPPVLLDCAGDRLFTDVPTGYLNRVVASVLACRIVYREGLDYVEHMPAEAVARLAIAYLRQERETWRLAEQVAGSNLPDAARIAALLRQAGTGAALRRIAPNGPSGDDPSGDTQTGDGHDGI